MTSGFCFVVYAPCVFILVRGISTCCCYSFLRLLFYTNCCSIALGVTKKRKVVGTRGQTSHHGEQRKSDVTSSLLHQLCYTLLHFLWACAKGSHVWKPCSGQFSPSDIAGKIFWGLYNKRSDILCSKGKSMWCGFPVFLYSMWINLPASFAGYWICFSHFKFALEDILEGWSSKGDFEFHGLAVLLLQYSAHYYQRSHFITHSIFDEHVHEGAICGCCELWMNAVFAIWHSSEESSWAVQ